MNKKMKKIHDEYVRENQTSKHVIWISRQDDKLCLRLMFDFKYKSTQLNLYLAYLHDEYVLIGPHDQLIIGLDSADLDSLSVMLNTIECCYEQIKDKLVSLFSTEELERKLYEFILRWPHGFTHAANGANNKHELLLQNYLGYLREEIDHL